MSSLIRIFVVVAVIYMQNNVNLFAENEYVHFKSSYPEVTENLRDPFWRPGYTPGKEQIEIEEVKIVELPPDAFSITGISGALGTANVTVTMNNDIIVDVNEEFPFEYQGKTFMLKVIEANEDFIVIDNKGEKISVPFGRTDATP